MGESAEEAAERQWQFMLETKMARGGRGPCTQCGERNGLDNMQMCPLCWNDYCWRCVRRQPLVSAPGAVPRVWRCDCGGTLRSMTNEEWLRLVPRGP